MSIVRNEVVKSEKLNESVYLELINFSEEFSSWNEVHLITQEERIVVGAYFTDSIAGTRDWIDYNSKCIIFYNGNRYENFYFVRMIFDIERMEFVHLSREEIEKEYGIKIRDNIDLTQISTRKLKKK